MSSILEPIMTTDVQFDCINFLQELVAIRSYSGEESNAANYMVETMNGIGFDSAHVDEAGNAIGTRASFDADGNINRHIVLLGHMDTVKGDIDVRIENDKLYGRGTVDAKGPLATFVAATAAAKLSPGTRVTVIGAVEEESSTSRGARFAAQQYSPDFCVIGEPSGWDGITIGYKGIVQVNYLLEKPMGHSSGLQSGVPERAIEFWNRIREYTEEFNNGREKLFDQLLPAIRDFHFTCDGLLDHVKFHASIRLPLEFDRDAFENWIRELDPDAVVKIYGYETAYRSDRRNELARAFNKVIRQRGERPKFKVKTGTCDMNVVGPAWDCPIVAYGPGDSSLDHTPNEHIVLEEYLVAIDVLRQVLEAQ